MTLMELRVKVVKILQARFFFFYLCRDAETDSFFRRSKRVTETAFEYNLDGRGITEGR